MSSKKDLLKRAAKAALYRYPVVIDGDGINVYAAVHDKSIRVWVVKSGQERNKLTGHRDAVNALALKDDDKMLISGCKYDMFGWDTSNGTKVWALKHGTYMNHLSVCSLVTAGDKQLYWGKASGTISLLSLEPSSQGKVLKQMTAKENGHDKAVMAMFVLPDNEEHGIKNVVASGGMDGKVKLWRDCTCRFTHDAGTPVMSLAAHKTFLFIGLTDGNIQVVDITSNGVVKTLTGHSSAVVDMVWYHPGSALLSASLDSTLMAWKGVEKDEQIESVQCCEAQAPLSGVCYTKNNTTIYLSDKMNHFFGMDASMIPILRPPGAAPPAAPAEEAPAPKPTPAPAPAPAPQPDASKATPVPKVMVQAPEGATENKMEEPSLAPVRNAQARSLHSALSGKSKKKSGVGASALKGAIFGI